MDGLRKAMYLIAQASLPALALPEDEAQQTPGRAGSRQGTDRLTVVAACSGPAALQAAGQQQRGAPPRNS